jgi:cyclophilin family peptidyl-prolyl cis-trans isomerase
MMFGLGNKKIDHKEEIKQAFAHFKTNLGAFKVELFVNQTPETAWNFINLAEGKQKTERDGNFYDDLIFHRVINGFMIQGGCPEKSGRGGPGYRFGDEFKAELRHDKPGVLSMANAGPGTNGSQFFITLAPTPHLDNRHTVFGQVVEGMDIVTTIGKTRTGPMDRPVEDVVIESITIERVN